MASARHFDTPLLPFSRRGGARRGAGRKCASKRRRVSHKTRSRLLARHPLLVTIRLRSGLPSLRRRRELALIRRGLAIAAERFGVRFVQHCVLSNHAHLIVEVADQRSLARAMKGLLVRIARGLNGLWERSGSVFDDHDHARALKTPREVRNALVYVLQNARKHGALPRTRSMLVRRDVRRLEGDRRGRDRSAGSGNCPRSNVAPRDRLAQTRSDLDLGATGVEWLRRWRAFHGRPDASSRYPKGAVSAVTSRRAA